jgi:hypothetical protein
VGVFATAEPGSVANSATGAAAAFSEAADPLAQGLAPVAVPTADLPTTAPTTSGISSGGNGSGGTIGQATGILELGLTNILANLTGALSNLGTLSADPAGTVTGLVPPLEGAVSDVIGTRIDLSSLMPLSGTTLPSLGTGAGGLDTITGIVGSLPIVSTGAHARRCGGHGHGGRQDAQELGARAVGECARPDRQRRRRRRHRSNRWDHAHAPLAPPAVQSPSGALPAPPTVSVRTVNSNGGSTTVNIPLPSLPVSAPPVTIPLGPVNVGVNLGGANSGATPSLP